MLLDVGLGEDTLEGTLSGGLATIDLIEELLEAEVLELVTGEPGVLVLGLANPLDLVLEGLTVLTAGENAVDDALLLEGLAILGLDVDLDGLLHLGGLLVRDLDGLLAESLLVLTTLVTPLDVLVGGLVKVLLDVVEGVLSDVGELTVGVLEDSTLARLKFTSKELDHGGLTGTVSTNTGNARGHGDTNIDVLKLGLLAAGVGEGDVSHGHDGTTLGLDTIQRTRLGELEGKLGSGQVVVSLGLRESLDELGKVTLVVVELEGVEVDNVGGDVVEELGVVGDNEGSDVLAGVTHEVVDDPLNIEDIQVVSGLIHKENIGLTEHSDGKGELHALTTREGGNGVVETALKARLDKSRGDLLFGKLHLLHDGVLGELDDGPAGLLGRDIGLHKDGLELVDGEALNLAVGDGGKEGGLTGRLGGHDTVAHTTLEVETGVVEKNTGTVGKGETAITELLELLVLLVLFELLLGTTSGGSLTGDHLLANSGGDGLTVSLLVLALRHENLEDRDESLLVVIGIGVGGGEELGAASGELEGNLLGLIGDLTLELGHGLLDGSLDLVDGGGSEGGDAVATLGNVEESLVGSSTTGTALGVSDLLGGLGKSGLEHRHEGGDVVRVVDELGQVLSDDGTLTLDGGLLLSEATLEERHSD
mmetsp:Transcript_9766/g.16099  ORF Transcript_9766/g.16099 Transcript_9766/m.16099 type:complete len:648 (+) Transcript_9766:596-2539(+)